MAKSKDNPTRLGKEARLPSHDMIVDLCDEMRANGEDFNEGTTEMFRLWMKQRAEESLWFFCRYVINMKDDNGKNKLDSHFHKDEICPWLTDFSTSRHKLLMLPVGHLKTSIASHGMPIHMLIQPSATNLYFPVKYSGGRGSNTRIVLGAETQPKARENLGVIKEVLETNPWIVWLWPDLVWDNFNDSPKWANDAITLPRTRPFREPTITAYGVENPITGGHYDAIVADDIATIKAGQSTVVMDTVKTWLKRSFTRLHDRFESIHDGIGTHQGESDVYSDWEKRGGVETLKRSIEEKDLNGELRAIWPEEWTPEKLAKLREDTDAITWSLWYMNRPVASKWSAMDWSTLREFRWIGNQYGVNTPMGLWFEETEVDREFMQYKQSLNSPLARFAYGRGLEPVQGNRQKMIQRWFGKSMSQEQIDHLKSKYDPDGLGISPAQTPAKSLMEEALGLPPRHDRNRHQ